MHSCNPSIWEVDAGGPGVRGQPGLYETSLKNQAKSPQACTFKCQLCHRLLGLTSIQFMFYALAFLNISLICVSLKHLGN